MVSDGKYIVLDIENTVDKDDTTYQAEGQWTDSDKIRFRNGRIEKMGGWEEREVDQYFEGRAREIHSWREIRNMPHYAVGTNSKMYIEELGSVYDVTPVDTSVSASNFISTTSGSPLLTVSVAGHGRAVGDYVVFTSVQDVSVGGVTVQGLNVAVVSVISVDAFMVSASTATATVVSDGGLIKLDMLLPSGLESTGASYGYGAGPYGEGTYGTPRTASTLTTQLRQWSADNWGEDLIACPRGGKVYYWDATTSVTTRMQVLSNAPVSNNVIFVHPNEHLVLLGTWPVGTSAIDPMLVRWSDRSDPNNFAISAGTRAGDFRLQGGGSEIIGYAPSRKETVIFTDDAVWSMYPLNSDLVFGFDQLATNSGLIAQHAAADIDGTVYWMSNRNFYKYEGNVQLIPNTIVDYVFGRLNYRQKGKIFCGVNKDFQEIMWLYQSTDADPVDGDVDSYVKYNWIMNAWDVGTFDRLVWEDSGVFENPIAIDSSGIPYNQESGVNDGNSGMVSYIESSYFDIEDGTDMLLLDQFIPDFILAGEMSFTITTKKWPNGPEEVKGPYSITPTTRNVSLRARGRQAKVRFSSSAVGAEWGVGKPRYRVRKDGQR